MLCCKVDLSHYSHSLTDFYDIEAEKGAVLRYEIETADYSRCVNIVKQHVDNLEELAVPGSDSGYSELVQITCTLLHTEIDRNIQKTKRGSLIRLLMTSSTRSH